MAIVDEKRKGHEVRRIQEPDEEQSPPDLMEALRRSLEQVESGRPRRGRRNGNGGSATLSKSELEERARKLAIPGRSKMTKDELAEAIASTE
jgi:DNA end-binding protein Ku